MKRTDEYHLIVYYECCKQTTMSGVIKKEKNGRDNSSVFCDLKLSLVSSKYVSVLDLIMICVKDYYTNKLFT